MRQIGLVGVLAAFVAVSAHAEDSRRPCLGLDAGNAYADAPAAQGEPLLFTDNQCEAMVKREFRLSLFEIPQENEDPMTISVGIKNRGGIIRLRIPFSF